MINYEKYDDFDEIYINGNQCQISPDENSNKQINDNDQPLKQLILNSINLKKCLKYNQPKTHKQNTTLKKVRSNLNRKQMKFQISHKQNKEKSHNDITQKNIQIEAIKTLNELSQYDDMEASLRKNRKLKKNLTYWGQNKMRSTCSRDKNIKNQSNEIDIKNKQFKQSNNIKQGNSIKYVNQYNPPQLHPESPRVNNALKQGPWDPNSFQNYGDNLVYKKTNVKQIKEAHKINSNKSLLKPIKNIKQLKQNSEANKRELQSDRGTQPKSIHSHTISYNRNQCRNHPQSSANKRKVPYIEYQRQKPNNMTITLNIEHSESQYPSQKHYSMNKNSINKKQSYHQYRRQQIAYREITKTSSESRKFRNKMFKSFYTLGKRAQQKQEEEGIDYMQYWLKHRFQDGCIKQLKKKLNKSSTHSRAYQFQKILKSQQRPQANNNQINKIYFNKIHQLK